MHVIRPPPHNDGQGLNYDPLERCSMSGNQDAYDSPWCEICASCGWELGQHAGGAAKCRLGGGQFRRRALRLYMHSDFAARAYPPTAAPTTQRSPGAVEQLEIRGSIRINPPFVIPDKCSGPDCAALNEWGAPANAGAKWYCGQCRMMRDVFR